MEETLVYDKAKWHFEAENFPKDLPDFQGYVHTGFLLGWLIEKQLVNQTFWADFAKEKEEFLKHQITAPQLFEKMDGVLASDQLNEEGNAFIKDYFESESANYFSDFIRTLKPPFLVRIFTGYKSSWGDYGIKDNWGNYEKIKKIINQRYVRWKSRNNDYGR